MAGELGDLLIGEGHVDPPVAGGDYVGDFVEDDAGLLHHVLHDLVGAAAVLGAGGANHVRPHYTGSIYDDRLGHGGAYINTGEEEP